MYIGDPFYSSYELPEHDVAILSVTVTAINCNGQRVKVCIITYNYDDDVALVRQSFL